MNKKPPINLDLATLTFPPMAIASILHRITGIILFILMPIMLYFWDKSLRSEDSYSALIHLFTIPYIKLVLWAFASALGYHMLAGIRHMMMDLGIDEGLDAGRRSAILIIASAIFVTIFLGVVIW